jgi:hypothetical protein
MIPSINTNQGLVKAIVIFLIVLLILAYFGLNLRGIVESPTFQDNWNYIKGGVVSLWNSYLKAPATYLWNLFIPFVWKPFEQNLQQMQKNTQYSTTTSTATTLMNVSPPSVE